MATETEQLSKDIQGLTVVLKSTMNVSQQLASVMSKLTASTSAYDKTANSLHKTLGTMSSSNSVDKLFSSQSKSIVEARNNLKLFHGLLERGNKVGIGTLQQLTKAQKDGTKATYDWGGGLKDVDKKLISITARNQSLKNMATHVRDIGTNWQWVGRNMTAGLSVPLIALGASALKQYMEYQKEIAKMARSYASGPKGFRDDKKDIEALIEAQGHMYAQNRVGLAQTTADWTAMGYTINGATNNIKTAIDLQNRLATTGDVDLKTAQETVATLISVYTRGLNVSKMGISSDKFSRQLVNQLVAVSDATRIQMDEISTALPKVAGAAKLANMDMAQTASVLAEMRDKGVQADTAANALATALSRLSGIKSAAEGLKEFGLSLYEIGNNKRKAGIDMLGELSDKINGLKAAGNDKAIDQLMTKLFSGRQTPKMVDALREIGPALKEIKMKEAEAISIAAKNNSQVKALSAEDVTSDFAKGLVASGEYGVKYLTAGNEGLAKMMVASKNGDKEATRMLDNLETVAGNKLKEMQNNPEFKFRQVKEDIKSTAQQLGAALAPAVTVILGLIDKVAHKLAGLSSGWKYAIAAGLGFVAVVGPITAIIGQMTQLSGVVTSVYANIRTLGRGMAELSGTFIEGIGGEEKLHEAAEKAGINKPSRIGGKTFVNKKDYNKLTDAAMEQKNTEVIANTTALAGQTTATEANTAALLGKGAEGAAASAGSAAQGPLNEVMGLKKDKNGKWRTKVPGAPGSRVSNAMGDFADEMASPNNLPVFNAKAGRYQSQIGKKSFLSNFQQSLMPVHGPQLPGPSGDLGANSGILAPELKKRGTIKKLLFGGEKLLTEEEFAKPGKVAGLKATGAGVKQFMKDITAFDFFKGGAKKGLGGVKGMAGKAAGFMGENGVMGGAGKGIMGATKALALGPLEGMAGMASALAPLLPILAAIAAAVAIAVIAFKAFKDHGTEIMAKLKPGLDAIKKAIDPIWQALKHVIDPFKDILNMFKGDEGKKFFEGLASAAGQVMKVIAGVINFMKPYIMQIISIVSAVFGAVAGVIKVIIRLIQGDFGGALAQARLMFFYLAKAALSALALIPRAFALVLKGIGGAISKIPGIGKHIAGPILAASKFIDGAADKMTGAFDKNIDKLKKGAAKIDKPKAKTHDNDKNPLGIKQPVDVEVKPDLTGPTDDNTSNFLSALKSRIDDVMGKVKDSVIKSFDDMVKARMKTFDDQIKSIDDLEKKENELLRVQQYNSQRADLLRKKNLNRQAYERNRAQAIYEGRIDDARDLDATHAQDVADSNKDIQDLDDGFNRDTEKIARDAQKEKIQADKDAAKEQYDIEEQALKDRLDIITKYTPENVGAMQDQLNQMTEAMRAYVPEFAGIGTDSMAAWAGAIKDARADLVHEAFWSGKAAGDAAVAGAGGAPIEPTDTEDPVEPTDPSQNHGSTGSYGPGTATSPTTPSKGPQYGVNYTNGTRKSKWHTGGTIPGSTRSDVPATLQEGEFVIQRGSVQKFGSKFFQQLNEGELPMFHTGGSVGEKTGKAISDNISARIQTALGDRIASVAAARQVNTAAMINPVGGKWQDIVHMLDGQNIKYSIGSTTGGVHVPNSYHYKGKAVDLHGDMMGIFNVLAKHQSQLAELFYSPAPYGIKNSKRIHISEAVRKGHYNHVHAAIYDQGGWLHNGKMAMNTSGKKEFILSNDMIKALSQGLIPMAKALKLYSGPQVRNANSNVLGGGGSSDAPTLISVDTFIGQEAWFEDMMRKYNLGPAPASDRKFGATTRNVSSYKTQTVRSRR